MHRSPDKLKHKRAGCCIVTLITLAILLVLGAVTAMTVGPKVYAWGKQLLARQHERSQWARSWQPPGALLEAGVFFPEQVGEFRRADSEPYWDVVGKPGIHALYTFDSLNRYVSVYQMTDEERQQLYGRLEEKCEQFKDSFAQEYSGGTSSSRVHIGNRYSCSIRVDNHYRHVVFWWIKGWLFQFSGEDAEELDPFIEEYLGATTRQKE